MRLRRLEKKYNNKDMVAATGFQISHSYERHMDTIRIYKQKCRIKLEKQTMFLCKGLNLKNKYNGCLDWHKDSRDTNEIKRLLHGMDVVLQFDQTKLKLVLRVVLYWMVYLPH